MQKDETRTEEKYVLYLGGMCFVFCVCVLCTLSINRLVLSCPPLPTLDWIEEAIPKLNIEKEIIYSSGVRLAVATHWRTTAHARIKSAH